LGFTPTARLPAIVAQPQDVTVRPGQSASFLVDTLEATGQYTFQWQLAPPSGSFVDRLEETTPAFDLVNLNASDDGTRVRVLVSSSSGTVTSAIATIEVIETGTGPTLAISPITNAVPAAGADYTIEVESDESWAALALDPWLTVDTTAGTGNASVTVTVAPNDGEEARVGTIEIGNVIHVVRQPGASGDADQALSGLDFGGNLKVSLSSELLRYGITAIENPGTIREEDPRLRFFLRPLANGGGELIEIAATFLEAGIAPGDALENPSEELTLATPLPENGRHEVLVTLEERVDGSYVESSRRLFSTVIDLGEGPPYQAQFLTKGLRNAAPIREGWFDIDGLGVFRPSGNERGWIFQRFQEWLFVEESTRGYWVYVGELGWVWTNNVSYPYGYVEDGSVIFFGDTKERANQYYDFDEARWIERAP
jgi:hypothetical protein